jgi:cyclophilin family peptidyl-prolyl cis-trans isomerase
LKILNLSGAIVGKKERIRKIQAEEEKRQKKEYLAKVQKEKHPWWTPWKRVDFWVYVGCLILIIAFPFIMNKKLIVGDQAIIHTTKGDIEIELYAKDAPKTVENFQKLVKKNYFSNIIWHRVIKGFMIQSGDPTGTGTGGESAWGGTFEDEINPQSLGLSDSEIKTYAEKGYDYNFDLDSHKMTVGAVAMANSGPNTNGSQFFIITEKDQNYLNGQHTVFGKVIEGLDVAAAISAVETDENDKPKESVYINSIELM